MQNMWKDISLYEQVEQNLKMDSKYGNGWNPAKHMGLQTGFQPIVKSKNANARKTYYSKQWTNE